MASEYVNMQSWYGTNEILNLERIDEINNK